MDTPPAAEHMPPIKLTLSDIHFPIRIRLGTLMSDLELMRFSSANECLRIEREPNGDLTARPLPGANTSRMSSRLTRLLAEWTDLDQRGICFGCNCGFTLADGSVRSPDAAWLSLTRWHELTGEEQAGFAPICPEFIIELRSPSDRLADLRTKMKEWLANGVELAWLIDPKRRVVEVYRPNEQPDIFEDPSSVQGTGPIRGFEIVLSRIWG